MTDTPRSTSLVDSPALDAMVSVRANVPEDAMSAGLLGTERTGHGARIREDGLIATIGYVINEAEEIWITTNEGVAVPGFVVGYDFESGLGLIKPSMLLSGPVMEIGASHNDVTKRFFTPHDVLVDVIGANRHLGIAP